MAKKYEFRPDNDRKTLLQRLHLSQQQRRNLVKWLLYALVLVVLSVLQDVIFTPMKIFGASSDLVPCAIILICVVEGAQSGCVFALVASLIYLYSGTAPGPYAMVFITIFAILVSAFRQGYLRKGFAATMLCTAGAMLAYELALFAIGLFLHLTTPKRLISFAITALLSMIAAPILYLLANAINAIGGDAWKE